MDHAAFHVVYVDKRASQDLDGQYVQRPATESPSSAGSRQVEPQKDRTSELLLREIEDVRHNVRCILSIFNGVHICTSGQSCMAKLAQLDVGDTFHQPILTMVELQLDSEPDDTSQTTTTNQPSDHNRHDISLLQHISALKADTKLSNLVVPIAMIRERDRNETSIPRGLSTRLTRPSSGGLDRIGKAFSSNQTDASRRRSSVLEPWKIMRCLDSGATDVLPSPLSEARIGSLTVHAYHARAAAQKERSALLAKKRDRKRSWVGFDDQKPYAYLREQMVSRLMTGICDPENEPYSFDLHSLPDLGPGQEWKIIEAINSWAFSAHEFSDDELVHAASLMLRHTLSMPELEEWRLSIGELKTFLLACRAAYNAFVHYHNFRHVIDVMQAVFYFLLQIGSIPPFPDSSTSPQPQNPSSIAALLKPFDALTLLISAIGHDVGHPGVNNAFLVSLNAPLAQLYNDKSVLESFHCAAYSQILRRYWKNAFGNTTMRCLMINSILATDMGLHFNYMQDAGHLQQKLHDNNGTDGWSVTVLEEYKTLTCGLLIKCADISNVARPFRVAAQWADILQEEFANQGVMEREVGIETTLFGGPPELGNVTKLANSQNGFMNIFARPLFEVVTDILPCMAFAVDEMKANTDVWKGKIEQEASKLERQGTGSNSEGVLSPRTRSPNRSWSQPEASHPEGLPASAEPTHPTFSASMQNIEEEARRASFDRTQEIREYTDRSSSPFRDSRRSSLGLAAGHGGSFPDQISYSRRSSGALSASQHQSITARRSSNTSPSQLQLGSAPESRTQAVSAENVQPTNRGSEGSEDTLSQSQRPSVSAPSYGSGGDLSRRTKNDDIRRPSRSSNNTSGRFSMQSNQRDSSGAHTNISQSAPYSPTTTQATSILTTNSSEPGSAHRNGSAAEGATAAWSKAPKPNIPNTVDVDHLGQSCQKNSEVKTSIMSNGTTSPNEERERAVIRKSSRFRLRDLWRKKGKMEASP